MADYTYTGPGFRSCLHDGDKGVHIDWDVPLVPGFTWYYENRDYVLWHDGDGPVFRGRPPVAASPHMHPTAAQRLIDWMNEVYESRGIRNYRMPVNLNGKALRRGRPH